jgi:acyl-CoA oxidase
MDVERKESNLDKDALAGLIHSYTHIGVPMARIRELRKKCMETPDLVISHSYYYESREESIIRSLKYSKAIQNFIKVNSLLPSEEPIVYQSSYGLHSLNLNYVLALPALALQSDEDQIKEWLPKLKSLEIIACYAQTELSHGSNVRGIETEAVYDHSRQEFVITSPSISSCKWWIGTAGLCANHALLIAQLKIQGRAFGPHAFFIQVRSFETHDLLPGVEMGDIGPKMGLDHMDNGYLKFSQFRVPKRAMLNRFARISEKGKYQLIDKNGIKILYLSLVASRFGIIVSSWFNLACALTITIRYSILRKQFNDPEKKGVEKKILDYQIQQFKLFIPLAFLFGIIFSRKTFFALMECAKKEVDEKKGRSLQFTHAIMSLFKSFFTDTCVKFIAQLRSSCGGHGFLKISGLPTLYFASIPTITYEGDNHILTLQAVKFIISLAGKEPPDIFKFLFQPLTELQGPVDDPVFIEKSLENIAKSKLKRILNRFNLLMAKFGNKEKVWNDFLQVEGIAFGFWVAQAIFYKSFLKESLEIADEGVKKAIGSLRTLYFLDVLDQGRVELKFFDGLDDLQGIKMSYLAEVRKHALVLIEAFEIPDGVLNTAIGRKEGDPYHQLFEENSKLNQLNLKNFSKVAKKVINPKL